VLEVAKLVLEGLFVMVVELAVEVAVDLEKVEEGSTKNEVVLDLSGFSELIDVCVDKIWVKVVKVFVGPIVGSAETIWVWLVFGSDSDVVIIVAEV
jgi:hypothetical protein